MKPSERRAPASLSAMKRFAEQLKDNPEQAQRFFRNAGIVGEDGKLAPEYRPAESLLDIGRRVKDRHRDTLKALGDR